MMELEELFENVEDIADPSLMDHILARWEEIQSENEEFMQILVKKEYLMVITWDQPWYQKTNSFIRTMQQINEKDKFRTDSISQDESNKIQRNWEKFQKMFGVPNKLICLARWRNKAKDRKRLGRVRRFVISFLARGLQRNLFQVYKYVRAHYGGPVRGKYSKYEENIMRVCVYHFPKNAVPILSAILSRESRGIYQRLSQIVHGKPEIKVLKWTLPLATKFLKLLMQYTGESVVENLKQKRFEKSIWLKLGKDMDQHYICLQRFWHEKLHVQLFVKADVKIKKLRRKIFEVLKLYPHYKVWTDIRWKEVTRHFPDGFSPKYLNKICYIFFYNKAFKGLLKKPLEDVISQGIQRNKFSRNRRLKTLVFNENQELEIVKYDNKLKLIF